MGSIARQIMEKIGSKIEIYVTAADADKQTGLFKFWTQLDPSGLEQIENESDRFQFMAQRALCPEPHDTLSVGELCIAKYLEDGQWYRARIDSVTGNDVIAFFIDYGNTEIIPRAMVRSEKSIDKSVFTLPGQATECIVAGVSPAKDPPLVAKGGIHGYLKKVLVDHSFTAEPKQMTDEGLEMKLVAESGESLADKLINDGVGVFRPQAASVASAGSQSRNPRGFTQTKLSVGSREKMYVSNVVSLDQFWIQQAIITDDLDSLMDNISNLYDNLKPGEQSVTSVEVGDACVAKFSEDGANYRAKVLKVTEPTRCLVQFVDFGNSEVVSIASLKVIERELASYPAIAVECSLSGVDGTTCSPKAVERFEELTAEKELCGKVVGVGGDTCSVLLIDPQGQENSDIVSVLVREGLASRGEEQFQQVVPPAAAAASMNGGVKTGGDMSDVPSYSRPILRRGSKVVVQIIAVRGTDDISCQLMNDADAFNIMMDRLQMDYANLATNADIVKAPRVGQSCCVMFSEDDCWYRARVMSVQGNYVKVQYVDYGNGEVVEASKIKRLKAEYLTLTVQCVECRLEGIPSLEGPAAEKAINLLDERTEENFVASIAEVQGEKYSVILTSGESGAVLNDEIETIVARQVAEHKAKTPPKTTLLAEASHSTHRSPPKAPPAAVAPPPPPPPQSPKAKLPLDVDFWRREKLGTKEVDVYISHVENPGKFYCQLVSQEGPLNLLMGKIHTRCTESKLQVLHNGCVGSPCVAQFSEDSGWYRGVVKEQKNGFYRVWFVDYGNEEDVPIEKVRAITDDLTLLPQQAVPCCLSGWNSKSDGDHISAFLRELLGKVDKFQLLVKESRGMAVVQVRWQQKDMLRELRKIAPSLPQGVLSPKAASKTEASTKQSSNSIPDPPFTISSAVDAVDLNKPILMAASSVKGPTKFYSQLCSQYDQLLKLSTEMNSYYESTSMTGFPSPVRGMFCAGKSASDGSWYRAKVVRAVTPGKFKVRFVDYGDIAVLEAGLLRELRPRFRTLPTQAIKCRLSGVTTKFEAIVLDQELEVVVKTKTGGKLEIEYHDGNVLQKIHDLVRPADQTASTPREALSTEPPSPSLTRPQQLGGTEAEVYISHVEDLGKFYVQLSSRSDEIDVLQQKLKIGYGNDANKKPPSTLAVGTSCCAQFSEDADWYRAVVVRSTSPGKVLVQFVDFGNSEEQTVASLRHLLPEYLQQSVMAVECGIKGVGSSTTKAAVNEFQDLIIDRALQCKFFGDQEPYQVEFPELEAEVTRWQASEDNAEHQAMFSNVQGVTVGIKEEVFVSSITDPGSFWCQLARLEDKLVALMDSIDAHYSALLPNEEQLPVPPVAGAPCIAQFADDGGWYRAKITEVRPTDCTVTFVDYGNSDKVANGYIKRIKEEFLALEPQAVPCRLDGVTQVGEAWTEEASDSLGTLTGDRKILAEVIGLDSVTSKCRVTLLDMGMSIGQKLIDGGLAKPAARSPCFASAVDDRADPLSQFGKLNLRSGSLEKVYVTVVNSLVEFYCQIASRVSEELEPMSERLQEEAPSLDSYAFTDGADVAGVPCAAKFSADDQWYRATMMAERADGTVGVFFVDYGNEEGIPREQIKRIGGDYLSLPAQVLKCALARVPETSSSDVGAVSAFEELVLESEALTAELIGVEGDGTSVVRLLKEDRQVVEDLGLNTLAEETESRASEQSLEVMPVDGRLTWPDITAGQVVEVFVNAIQNPQDFWCRIASTESELNALMASHASSMIEDEMPSCTDIRPGQPCLCYSNQDGRWCRSEVVEVIGDKVKVRFVDAGCTRVLTKNKIKPLYTSLGQLSRQAFRCKLAALLPRGGSWDASASAYFRELTSDHSLMAEIMTVDRRDSTLRQATVKLQDGVQSISELMIEKGHATVVGDTAAKEATWDGPTYERASLTSGKKHSVRILSVVGGSEFYCRLEEQEAIYEDITVEVNAYVNEVVGRSRVVAVEGMPCLARCGDEEWRRAEILGVRPGERIEVWLVDEAETEKVSLDDLQQITCTLLAFPPQAVRCSFNGPPTGEDLRRLIDGKSLQAELCGSCGGAVALFDGDVSVAMLIDTSREALQETESSGEEEVLPVGIHLPDSFRPAFDPLKLEAGQEVTLCLVTIDAPDEITCQMSHHDQKVLDIDQEMLAVYADSPRNDWTPEVGEPCAAKHSEYDDWYRATVVAVDLPYVKVYYADYGGTDTVVLESVRELSEELRQIPAQATRFRLTTPLVPPADWNKKAKKALEGECTESDLHVKILEVQEKITIVELLQADQVFLAHLVDQSQTESLNDDEGEEGEFFDAVAENTAGDDAVEDSALDSIFTETVDTFVQDILAEVTKTLSEEERVSSLDDGRSDSKIEIKDSIAELVEELFEKAAGKATTDLLVTIDESGEIDSLNQDDNEVAAETITETEELPDDSSEDSSVPQDDSEESPVLQDAVEDTSVPQDDGEDTFIPQDASEDNSVPEDAYEHNPVSEYAYVPQDAGENTYVPQDASEDTPVPEDASEDTSVQQAASEDTPVPEDASEDASEDTPVPEDASEDTPVLEDASEDTPVHQDASEDTPVHQDASEDTPGPEDASEDTPVSQDTYEHNPVSEDAYVPQDASEDTYVPEDASEDTYVPEDASEDTPVPEDASEDTPILQDASENTSVLQDDSEGTSVPEDAREGTPVPQNSSVNSSIPQASSSLRIISMKDILDQLVDHTLQTFNVDPTADRATQEKPETVDTSKDDEEDSTKDDNEDESRDVVNGDVNKEDDVCQDNMEQTESSRENRPGSDDDDLGETPGLESDEDVEEHDTEEGNLVDTQAGGDVTGVPSGEEDRTGGYGDNQWVPLITEQTGNQRDASDLVDGGMPPSKDAVVESGDEVD